MLLFKKKKKKTFLAHKKYRKIQDQSVLKKTVHLRWVCSVVALSLANMGGLLNFDKVVWNGKILKGSADRICCRQKLSKINQINMPIKYGKSILKHFHWKVQRSNQMSKANSCFVYSCTLAHVQFLEEWHLFPFKLNKGTNISVE